MRVGISFFSATSILYTIRALPKVTQAPQYRVEHVGTTIIVNHDYITADNILKLLCLINGTFKVLSSCLSELYDVSFTIYFIVMNGFKYNSLVIHHSEYKG
jgi:hypothetical protein